MGAYILYAFNYLIFCGQDILSRDMIIHLGCTQEMSSNLMVVMKLAGLDKEAIDSLIKARQILKLFNNGNYYELVTSLVGLWNETGFSGINPIFSIIIDRGTSNT